MLYFPILPYSIKPYLNKQVYFRIDFSDTALLFLDYLTTDNVWSFTEKSELKVP